MIRPTHYTRDQQSISHEIVAIRCTMRPADEGGWAWHLAICFNRCELAECYACSVKRDPYLRAGGQRPTRALALASLVDSLQMHLGWQREVIDAATIVVQPTRRARTSRERSLRELV